MTANTPDSPYKTKYAGAEKPYGIDWTDWLADEAGGAGDDIGTDVGDNTWDIDPNVPGELEVVGSPFVERGVTVPGQIGDRTRTGIKIKGGIEGETYKLTNTIKTPGGLTEVGVIYVHIVETDV